LATSVIHLPLSESLGVFDGPLFMLQCTKGQEDC
jgi:hypothetical protein